MKLFRGKNRKKKEDANAQSLIQKQDPAGLLEVSLDLPIGRLDKTPSTHLVKATRISGGVKSPMTMTVMPSPASSGMQAASISSRNAVAVAVPQKLPSAVKMSTATVKIPPPRAMTIPLAASNKEPPERSMGESQDSISHHLASNLDLYEQAENCAVTRELVKKYVADIWNRGEVELIPEVCHPSLRFNGSVGMDRVGHQGFARMVATIRDALTDYHCEIHSMVVEGNKAFSRMRFTGRHTGSLLGYDPTGRQVAWMGASEFTCKDGRILKVWELSDVKSLEDQLAARGPQ